MRKAELVLCKARREKSYLKVGAPAPRQEPQLLVGVGTGAKGVAALGCSRQHRPQEGGEVAARKKRLDVAARQKRLGVAPHKSWGLVWFVPARRERDRDSASLGKIGVLEQDS